MKKWLGMAILALVIGINFYIVEKIGYPPTEQQLGILRYLGLRGELNLWILRIISAFFVYGGVSIWGRMWGQLIYKKLYFWIMLVLIMSPLLTIVWMSYPILSALWILIIILTKKFSGKKPYIWMILAVVLVVVTNIKLVGYQPAIFNQFSLKQTQNEVTERISGEDGLIEKVSLPLWWRRIGENKYFMVYRDVTATILPYFDLETIFFGEVHPLSQKSVVMFFWPEVFLAVLGIYFLANEKSRIGISGLLAEAFGLSMIGYVFSEGAASLRLFWVLLPMSVLVGLGLTKLFELKEKKYILASTVGIMFLVLLGYGFEVNSYDLMTRSEYWLDNRQIIYDNWFKNISQLDRSKFKIIQVTTLVGDPRVYCDFYLEKECESTKFVFKNFNLNEDKPVSGTLYAGFSGEFVGPRFKNDIADNWKKITEDKGMKFISSSHTYDTVAYQYGNDIGLVFKE